MPQVILVLRSKAEHAQEGKAAISSQPPLQHLVPSTWEPSRVAQLPATTWAQVAQPGLQHPWHTAPELCPGKHHCSFKSAERSSSLKPRSCLSAPPLTAHRSCHFGEGI